MCWGTRPMGRGASAGAQQNHSGAQQLGLVKTRDFDARVCREVAGRWRSLGVQQPQARGREDTAATRSRQNYVDRGLP